MNVADNKNRYLVVIESEGNSFGAWAPDLPGCVAAADTLEECRDLMREAIEFHLEGLRRQGESAPEPTSMVTYVSVEAA